VAAVALAEAAVMGRLILIFIAAGFVFAVGQDVLAKNPLLAEGGILTGVIVVAEVVLSIGLGLLLHRLLFGRRRRRSL
jgi:hypothetical protein